jgi:hypothetical protein
VPLCDDTVIFDAGLLVAIEADKILPTAKRGSHVSMTLCRVEDAARLFGVEWTEDSAALTLEFVATHGIPCRGGEAAAGWFWCLEARIF